MNKATLIGRFAADPELKTTNSGKSVVSFTLAVDRPGTYGEEKITDWLDIVAWGKTAEFICKHFEKGEPIIVDGVITSRTWEDKDGKKRKAVEIVANSVTFVPAAKNKSVPQGVYEQAAKEEFTVVEDEDIPF